MRPLVILAISSLLLLAQGCTSFDKDSAGRESSVTTPESSTQLAVASNVPPVIPVSDPAANGGSSLPASSPYSQPSGAPVQQNINPAPFMTAGGGQAQGQTSGATSGGATLTTSGSLTSRADGTMSGPNDQPAATTGWGTQGPQAVPAAPSAKPAAQPAKAPPK